MDHTLAEPSQPPVNCYICDEKITSKNISLLRGCVTRHSKSSFSTKIEQVMGADFMVVVADEDTVCERCSKLLDLFDKLECDLNSIREKLKSYLNVKYHLEVPTPLEIPHLQQQLENDALHLTNFENHQLKVECEDTLDEQLSVTLYKCKYCQYMTHTQSLLLDHLKTHTKKVTYKCTICQMTFSSRPDIENHIGNFHQSVSLGTESAQGTRDFIEPDQIHRTFKCGLCFVTYKTRIELITHFESHRSSCPISDGSAWMDDNDDEAQNACDKSEDTHTEQDVFSTLDDIPEEVVPSGSDTMAVLDVPHDQEYVDVQEVLEELHSRSQDTRLSQEDQSDANQVRIDIEGNEFSDGDLLEQLQGQFHLVVGTIGDEQNNITDFVLSEAPHVMPGYQAGPVRNLVKPPVKIRMKPSNENSDSSSNRKIFVCSLCQLRSPCEQRMKRHIKGHIALSKRTHSCHICSKVLTTRSNMKRHISNHISDPVNCDICNEQLTDRLHLKHHLETLHPQTYTCSVCSESFNSKQLFKNHIQVHKERSHFRCDVLECTEVFLTEVEMKNHQSAKHGIVHELLGNKMFKCYICHKILTTYHNLKRHLANHEKYSGAIQCSICSQELLDKAQLKRHFGEYHPDIYQCGFCSQVFSSKKTCKIHELTHPERLFYKCSICEKVFPNERRLKKHSQMTHRDPHCQYCGKEINNTKKLVEHEKRHERHKQQYPCTECDKVFRTPSGLRYHMSVHTGLYSLHCNICNRGFHSAVVLAEHQATHTKEVRHTCDRCGRNFTSNSTYRLHRIWHDNPFPYTCKVCNRKFRHTSILAVHKRRAHTGERPYKCPHCPFTFNISSTLNKHLILHTKQYPYVCAVCSKGFTTRSKIAKHMEKAHQDSTMLNEKPKPCQYKMVLRPEEYAQNGTSVKCSEGESEDTIKQENASHQYPKEQVQHINVIRLTPGHPMYGMF